MVRVLGAVVVRRQDDPRVTFSDGYQCRVAAAEKNSGQEPSAEKRLPTEPAQTKTTSCEVSGGVFDAPETPATSGNIGFRLHCRRILKSEDYKLGKCCFESAVSSWEVSLRNGQVRV